MILTVTLSIGEKENPFTFMGATGNVQGDKWQKPVAYENMAQMFSRIGDDIRDVVLKEQIRFMRAAWFSMSGLALVPIGFRELR